MLRALVFLCANLAAGWRAATGAMLAEFVYRAITAGFYGALTQAFRKAEPAWAAGVAAMLLLPLNRIRLNWPSVSLAEDMRRVPGLIAGLLTCVPLSFYAGPSSETPSRGRCRLASCLSTVRAQAVFVSVVDLVENTMPVAAYREFAGANAYMLQMFPVPCELDHVLNEV